ncbi:bifunctional phosphatase PAP2/diacylglycerol kinase family protein [Streptomyces iconiensis]|uniref:Phosphatase PAP2 family protein n=1 Tax=Streptomyces iconiensis TaxID=1384038 RepID=A0ABT6ZV15_9ACTN|nr:phosphatase PAP2 family protein [Streptomyces iconiensis]MDJ1132687.1 phosphatase PAP2 family protein [Streptomyces iconiensis]
MTERDLPEPTAPPESGAAGAGTYGIWSRWDRTVFRHVAGRHWPGAERVLPRLSRSADHGRLWFAVAAGLTATGATPAKRAALRGTASLALASATVNTIGKRSIQRARPLLDGVPLIRRLRRQPFTSSFPSGHAASAAAFATGVALESRRWGLAVTPLAASVAFSRIYTGVHYPGDVLAGAALGVGAAFAVRGLTPSRSQLPAPARPVAEAPALPEGAGLELVANVTAGPLAASGAPSVPGPAALVTPPSLTAGGARGTDSAHGERGERGPEPAVLVALRSALPRANVVSCDPAHDELGAELDAAAARAAEAGGALGVCGGDGSVNAAARAAVRHGVPLVVVPGGTRNHFAADLGIDSAGEVRRAVTAGHAVAVDLGRFTPVPGAADAHGTFVNTFSLGSYPELVRVREKWAPRVGSGPAVLLAAWHVLRNSHPVEAGLAGRPHTLWLLFAGNCAYRGVGLAPVRRYDLADGLLDVRAVPGGSWARTRLLWSALGGVLGHRHRRHATRLRQLMITGIPPGSSLAYDGEVAPAPGQLMLTKDHEALTVYRPLPE